MQLSLVFFLGFIIMAPADASQGTRSKSAKSASLPSRPNRACHSLNTIQDSLGQEPPGLLLQTPVRNGGRLDDRSRYRFLKPMVSDPKVQGIARAIAQQVVQSSYGSENYSGEGALSLFFRNEVRGNGTFVWALNRELQVNWWIVGSLIAENPMAEENSSSHRGFYRFVAAHFYLMKIFAPHIETLTIRALVVGNSKLKMWLENRFGFTPIAIKNSSELVLSWHHVQNLFPDYEFTRR